MLITILGYYNLLLSDSITGIIGLEASMELTLEAALLRMGADYLGEVFFYYDAILEVWTLLFLYDDELIDIDMGSCSIDNSFTPVDITSGL